MPRALLGSYYDDEAAHDAIADRPTTRTVLDHVADRESDSVPLHVAAYADEAPSFYLYLPDTRTQEEQSVQECDLRYVVELELKPASADLDVSRLASAQNEPAAASEPPRTKKGDDLNFQRTSAHCSDKLMAGIFS